MPEYYGKSKTSHHDNDEFDLPEDDLRWMSRVLDIHERRRGNAKYRYTHRMRISHFSRLMEEADLRKRSKRLNVRRCRYTGDLSVRQLTKRGRIRRRQRRYRTSRETRKRYETERLSGARYDFKTTKRIRGTQRRYERRLYRDSLRRGDELTPHQVAVLLDDDIDDSEEEMDFVEPVGFGR